MEGVLGAKRAPGSGAKALCMAAIRAGPEGGGKEGWFQPGGHDPETRKEFSRTKASRVSGQKEVPKFHKLGSASLLLIDLSKQESLRQTHGTFSLFGVTKQSRGGEGPVTAT